MNITNQSKETFHNYEIEPYVSHEEKKEKVVPMEDISLSSISSSVSSPVQPVLLEKDEIQKQTNEIKQILPEDDNKKAPFQLDIREIKELYENIKSQIQQLK